jgi:hypothetical protein
LIPSTGYEWRVEAPPPQPAAAIHTATTTPEVACRSLGISDLAGGCWLADEFLEVAVCRIFSAPSRESHSGRPSSRRVPTRKLVSND